MVEEDFNVREETININDTEIEETIDIDSEHTIELENSNSNNISSSQYFPECPVHNHHTDNDSVCPDDPPCSCMSEIY